jgi:circadian clock protein KaiC
MDRCKTGLENLDKALDGGIPKNNFVAVTGSSGAGKTNFCIEFLYNGAVKFNEPGVFLTLEQNRSEILNASQQIGRDFQELLDRNMISIVFASYYDLDKLFFTLEAEVLKVAESESKRLVIDPAFFSEEDKSQIPFFKKLLKNLNCTTFITMETSHGEVSGLSFADGIIELDSNSAQRNVRVGKMRGTTHDLSRYALEITSNGIQVGEQLRRINRELLAEARYE